MLTFVHVSVGGFMSGFTCLCLVCVCNRKEMQQGFRTHACLGWGCRVVL